MRGQPADPYEAASRDPAAFAALYIREHAEEMRVLGQVHEHPASAFHQETALESALGWALVVAFGAVWSLVVLLMWP